MYVLAKMMNARSSTAGKGTLPYVEGWTYFLLRDTGRLTFGLLKVTKSTSPVEFAERKSFAQVKEALLET
jgi:hypothetical protein